MARKYTRRGFKKFVEGIKARAAVLRRHKMLDPIERTMGKPRRQIRISYQSRSEPRERLPSLSALEAFSSTE